MAKGMCCACGKEIDGAARSRCKSCHAEWARGWYANNPGKRQAASKKWMEANPEKWAEIRKRNRLRANFGLELEEYEQMVADQQNCCAICGDQYEGDTYGKLRVDHDHESGQVRGLLCNACNLGLGKFRDDPNVLLSALAYLVGQTEPVEV